MQDNRKDLTQKELLAAELINLNKQITAADRSLFLNKKGGSRSKLSMYMNGKIYDVDVALGMAKFFKKRIALKNKIISAHI